jgi:very-short-patch-repair endonuclease
VDCVWPDQRLIVELDGREAHETTYAFEQDRVRDRVLAAAGWHVIRITWRQLHEEARLVEGGSAAAFGSTRVPVLPARCCARLTFLRA